VRYQDTARDALRFALKIAPDLECSVTVPIAIQTRMTGYRAAYFSFVDRHILSELRQFAEAVVDECGKIAADMGGTSPETVTLEGEGKISEQIVDFIGATPDTAMPVIGSYGHGVRDRLILGSTTQRIILEIARRGMKIAVQVVP
jgi:nucleotide-binding universal stress UspA family protein